MNDTVNHPPEFKPGDRVYVDDAGLAALRRIMRHGHDPEPNHHGTVHEVWADGDVLIHFDDGMGAPYPPHEVHHLPEEEAGSHRPRRRCVMSNIERAAEVLIEHQQQPVGDCRCGWVWRQGQPYNLHLAEVLANVDPPILVPDGAEVTTEYGVRWSDQSSTRLGPNRTEADNLAADYPEGHSVHIEATVQRTVTTYRSEWTEADDA